MSIDCRDGLRWKSLQTFSPFLVTKLKLKVGSSRDWELEFTRDEGVFYFRFALAQPPRRNDSNREMIKAFSRTKIFPSIFKEKKKESTTKSIISQADGATNRHRLLFKICWIEPPKE